MSRPSTMKLIHTAFQSLKNSFKEVIKSGGYFCSTADIWSTKHRSSFGYTVHWISETFERNSVSLACKRFSGAHSFDAICRIINEIHEEYDLNICNLVATTTDNGSNFIKAFSEFGIVKKENFLNEYEEEFEMDHDSKDSANRRLEVFLPKRIRCPSHTLNLIATTDFNKLLQSKSLDYDKHKQILKKCSVLWSKVNRPKSSEQITSILGSQLKYPVITRWNSLYDSIKDLLSHRLKLCDLCQQLGIERFHDKEFEYLTEYIELLQPIAEAIDFLQRDDGMMFGYLLPSLATILTKYAKIQLRGSSKYLKTMAIAMIACVNTRFASYVKLDKTAQTAIVAPILCPAVKCQWLKALNPEFDVATEAKVANIAKDAVCAMAGEVKQLRPSPCEDDLSSYFNFSIVESSEKKLCGTASLSDTVFLAYLADTSKSLSTLNKYPLIKQAFLKFNAPLPSLAAVERLFSYASMLNAPKRGSLSDENFEKLLLLRVNNDL